MHKLLLTVAFLGLLVSGYLFITYVTPVPLLCTSGGGCHAAQASSFGRLLGIPTPLHGIIYYSLLCIGASLWNGAQSEKIYSLLVVLTVIGFLVSVWLTYIEAFVIEAWCLWCVTSAVLATLAFLIVALHPTMKTYNETPHDSFN